VCRGTQLLDHLRGRDELVGKEIRPSVHDAMADRHGCGMNFLLDCAGECGQGVTLRFQNALTSQEWLSICRTNLQCAVAAPDSFGASGQQRFFVAGAAGSRART